MKQHITIEQLNELSPKSRETLDNWLEKKDFDEYVRGYPLGQLLSIGQMIEFLIDDHDQGLHIYDQTPYLAVENRISHKKPGHMWSTNGWKMRYSHPNPWQGIAMKEASDELCDVLWRAVKLVLDPDRRTRTGDRIRNEFG